MLLAATAALMLAGGGVPLEPCTAQGIAARCATVFVPENRARPEARTIGLHVVVIPAARQPAQADAFTYLAGGPGGAAAEMAYTVQALSSRVNRTRDVVLVDQRGTGQSNPLTCVYPTARISTPAQLRAYVRSCLRAAPGDMRHYGTGRRRKTSRPSASPSGTGSSTCTARRTGRRSHRRT
jgi:hypothetical protein